MGSSVPGVEVGSETSAVGVGSETSAVGVGSAAFTVAASVRGSMLSVPSQRRTLSFSLTVTVSVAPAAISWLFMLFNLPSDS